MILKGDCIEVMKAMKPNSVDAIVCDPPYGLEFMGKEWDKLEPNRNNQRWKDKERKLIGDGSGKGGNFAERFSEMPHFKPKRNPKCRKCGHYGYSGTPCKCENPDFDHRANEHNLYQQLWHTQWLTEAYRVLKPGGSMLVMGGTRTSHRLACAIEDSGFIIKDTLAWNYGSGFPKAQDFSKATLKKFLRGWLEDVDHFLYKDGDFQFDCPYNCHLCDEVFQFFQVNNQDGEHRQDDVQEHSHPSEPLAKTLSDTLHKHKASYASLFFRLSKQGYQLHIVSSDGQLSQEEFSDLCQLYSEQSKQDESDDVIPQAYKDSSNVDILSCEFVLEKFEIFCHSYNTSQLPSYKHCNRINQFIQAKLLRGHKIGGLKPAWEPILYAVKPPEGSYVDNVLKWGVGAVNVDECRVGYQGELDKKEGQSSRPSKTVDTMFPIGGLDRSDRTQLKGRFPANVILDEEAGRMLDEQSGDLTSGDNPKRRDSAVFKSCYGEFQGQENCLNHYSRGANSGGASRFFYCAKASRSERNAGLDELPDKLHGQSGGAVQALKEGKSEYIQENHIGLNKIKVVKNNHPTVKPIKLFEYLIKLVTREGQIILDPFIGSGTTAIAAHNTGRKCIGIEKEDEYLTIATRRIDYWQRQPQQLALGDKNVSI